MATPASDPHLRAASRHQVHAREYMTKLYGNDPRLTELRLAKTSCTDAAVTALADALRVNTKVELLDLCDNGIGDAGATHLSEALLANTTLTEVLLDGNRIGEHGVRQLAIAMEGNLTVRHLSLDGNEPRHGAVSEAALLALDTMIQLNAHPLQVKRLVLDVQKGKAIDVVDMSLPKHTSATHDPTVHVDDYCTEVLARILTANTTVTRLDLSNQRIGDRGARALATMLLRNQRLDKLILTGNMITDTGARAFIDALQDNNCVRLVQLFDNLVSEDLVVKLEFAVALNRQPLRLKQFYPLLLRNAPELAHLELDDRQSQRYYDDVTLRLVFEALRDNTHLISFALPHGKVTVVGAQITADFLRGNTTLRHLDLSHNPIREGGMAIAQALCANTALEGLLLSNTQLTDECGHEIAAALEVNTTLTHLDLADNPGLHHCAAALVYSLNVNRFLRHLVLEGTSVGDKARLAIDDRLSIAHQPQRVQELLPRLHAETETLRDIDLRGAGVEDSGARLLAPAVRDNYVATRLDLSHNNLTFDGVCHILQSLNDNRVTLQELDLSHNPIGRGAHFGKLIAGLMATHLSLVRLDISATMLTTEGLEYMLAEVDAPKILQLREIGVADNEVDPVLATLFQLLVRCGRLHRSFKAKIRAAIREWRQGERRALPPPVLDFHHYLQFEDEALPMERLNAALPVLCGLIGLASYRTVRLGENRIDDDGAEIIAECIARSSSVESLQLQGNCLTDRGIAALTAAAKRNHKLTLIDISGQVSPGQDAEPVTLGDAAVEEMREMLAYNEQPVEVKRLLVEVRDGVMEHLDVSDRTTRQLTDSHIRMVCRVLPQSAALRSINLSNNYVSEVGLGLLCRALRGNKTVRELTLRNVMITAGEPSGHDVAALLRSGCELQSIDLSYNEVAPAFVPPVLEAMDENRCITFFGLVDCQLPPDVVESVSARASLNHTSALKDAVEQVKRNDGELKTFSAERGGYTDLNVIEVFTALRVNNTVQHVTVARNGLTDASGVSIVQSLADNATLTRLDLSGNLFGLPTLEALADTLRTNTTLCIIDVRDNAFPAGALAVLRPAADVNEACYCVLGDAVEPAEFEALQAFELNQQLGVKRGLQALRRGDPIEVLDSSGDMDSTDFAVSLIERAFLDYPDGAAAVHTLNLSNGRITDEGADTLRRIVVRSQHVTSLDASNNGITDVGAGHLASMLQVNTTLQHLRLWDNCMTGKGVAAIRRAMFQNHTVKTCDVGKRRERPPVDHETLLQGMALRDGKRQLRPPGEGSDTDDDEESNQGQLDKLVFLNNRTPVLKHFCSETHFHAVRVLDLSCALAAFDVGLVGRPRPAAAQPTLDDEGCIMLCGELSANTTVTHLNLSGNGLTSGSLAQALGNMLRANNTLRVLDLADNGFGVDMGCVADALTENDSVICIDASRNRTPEPTLVRLEMYQCLNLEPPALKRAVVALWHRHEEPRVIELQAPQLDRSALVANVVTSIEAAAAPPTASAVESEHLQEVRAGLASSLLHFDKSLKNSMALANGSDEDAAQAFMDHGPSKAMLIKVADLGTQRKLQLDDRSAVLLCQALKTNLSIRVLDLSWNAIGDRGAARIVALMQQNPGATKIALAHNSITDRTAAALAHLLETSTTLQVVDVSHTLVGVSLSPEPIIQALIANPKALHYDVTGCRFSPADAATVDVYCTVNNAVWGEVRAMLVAGLQQDPNVTALTFNSLVALGCWGPSVLPLVRAASERAPFIVTLELEYNDLGDEDFETVSDIVHRWPTLRTLSVACNNVTDPGPLCIALSSKAATLESLSLRRNKLGPGGAMAVAQMIRKNDSLTALDISENPFGRVGATFVLSALPMNDSLREVELAGDGISTELLQKVENALTLRYRHVAVAPTDTPNADVIQPFQAAPEVSDDDGDLHEALIQTLATHS